PSYCKSRTTGKAAQGRMGEPTTAIVGADARAPQGADMTITTSVSDDTLLITIDRPPVNALDLEAITSLEQAFADAAGKAPRNGVVLTGAGSVFSAGVDTRAFAGYGREQRRAMVLAITGMVARLLAIPVPVVAAVNGHALGGGFVLM